MYDDRKHAGATARPADLGYDLQGSPTEATLFAKMRDEMLTLLRQELETFHKRQELEAARAHLAPPSEPRREMRGDLHGEIRGDLHGEMCVASASDTHAAALATTHGKLSVLDRAPMLPSSPNPVSRRILPNLGAAALPPEPHRVKSYPPTHAPSLEPDPVTPPVRGAGE